MTPPSLVGVLCLLSLLDLIVCDAQPQNAVVYGGMNQNVTFEIGEAVAFKDILWKKGKNKVIEWEENLYLKPRSFPPFTNRTYLDTKSGNLTIFNVTSSDEDEYEVEYGSTKGSIKFTLKVIAPLPPLTLNCTLMDENIIIWCKLKEPYHTHEYLVNYTWQCLAAECKNDISSHELYLKKNDLPEEITCVAKNPMFEMKSPFVPSTCLPVHSRDRWPVCLFILLALLVSTGCYSYMSGGWVDRILCSRFTNNSQLDQMSKS